jgi:D-lactate dehydrogenase
MRYSHVGCNVVPEDIPFARGMELTTAKATMKSCVEQVGGKLPAEHGHGTAYTVPAETPARWKAMDPTNSMNPGVGGLPRTKHYL